ncbi:MAG: relaxase [Gammaproteobacteria bacterium]|nr:relaxase [Gammaproteobacteria bacterium]
MTKRTVDLRLERPLLDVVSYGRAGPRSLSRSQREYIERTVRRAPEVVIKVSGGARTLAGVEQSVRYVGRGGKLGLESDTGDRLGMKGFESDLVRDWNLDLEARARYTQRSIRVPRKPPKLVHNLIFSMPPGTPPPLLLEAVRKLARMQFGSDHRHALILHTDEPHPHVHVIATERAVRGQNKTPKPDGIYRAAERGESSYVRDRMRRADTAAASKEALVRTRGYVVDGWRAVSERLRADGYPNLANHVDRFLAQMPSVRTDAEIVSDQVRSSARHRDPRTNERMR